MSTARRGRSASGQPKEGKPRGPLWTGWSATTAAVASLFFLSGAAGLVYEVIWFKRFTHVWGSSTLAMAAVAASFLGGLGVGAHLGGRAADTVRRPLWWYGILEIGIGLAALLVPLEIKLAASLSPAIERLLPESVVLEFAVRFAVTFLVIGPACAMMGATLPLLVRQFTSRDGALDQAVGGLYAVNTLGAAAGCYLSGFHLLPAIGLLWSGNLAAAGNVAIGLAAIGLARRLEPLDTAARGSASHGLDAGGPSPNQVQVTTGATCYRFVLAAAALTGAAALVLQMTWARQLSLVVGGSTYAFTASLFVILVGMALGSLAFHAWLRGARTRIESLLVITVALTATTVLGMALIPPACRMIGDVRQQRANAALNALWCAGASGVVELLPALCMGMLFPMLVAFSRRQVAEVGRTVGSVYAWNTAGAIAGGILTSSWLIPRWGSHGAVAIAVAMYFAAVLALLAAELPRFHRRAQEGSPHVSEKPARTRWLQWTTAAVIGGVIVWLAARPTDPMATNLGLYLYSRRGVEVSLPRRLLYFREGPASNVLVTAEGPDRSLRVNGKIDASTAGDMNTQLGSAYFPRFFRPSARDVLVIGFGSGTTPGASLLVPDTQVTCCEIEPAVFAASKHFVAVNHRPERSKRFHIVLDDGRNFLQASPKQFDLIISEPSNPWMAGVSNLFTREFYETVARRLRPGGLFEQWVQTYQFTAAEYHLILRTLLSVFPHAAMLTTRREGEDTLIMASMAPLDFGPSTMAAVERLLAKTPAVRQDFERYFQTADPRRLLLRHFILDTSGLKQLLARDPSKTLNTDLNLRLEFDAPRRIFQPISHETVVPWREIFRTSETNWVPRLASAIGWDQNLPGHQIEMGDRFFDRGRYEESIVHYREAIRLDAKAAQAYRALGEALAKLGRYAEAVPQFEAHVRLEPHNAEAHLRLGNAWFSSNRHAQAAACYEEAMRLDPSYSKAHNNAGMVLGSQGQRVQAIEHFRKAIRLDPLNADAYFNKAEVQFGWGDLAAATDNYGRAVFLNPDFYQAHANRGLALAQLGRFREAAFHLGESLRIQPELPEAREQLARTQAVLRSYWVILGRVVIASVVLGSLLAWGLRRRIARRGRQPAAA